MNAPPTSATGTDMTLVYRRVDTLPRLAWCAVIGRNLPVTVFHGPWVETHGTFFVEGTWSGDFTAGAFDTALVMMGSGGRLQGDSVIFSTASHTLERLHLLREADRIIISPSLVFLLTFAGTRLDVRHVSYQADLLEMVTSIDNHVSSIPLADGRTIELIYYRNIRVSRGLNVSITHKRERGEFTSFTDYRSFLSHCLATIASNSSDPRRQIRYSPITTLSTGYDSAACSALAKEIGCKHAVTFRSSRTRRRNDDDTDDCGTRIGQALGMHVSEFDRTDYLHTPDYPEAEFVVGGDLGQDLPMSVFARNFEQRLVFCGMHGDTAWGRNQKAPKRDIIRRDMAGCSLIEFRLRVGFIGIYPAFFGCINQPSLTAISNSPELATWQVGGNYDRPIARRIAEEAGIPRGTFALRKRAVTVLLNRGRRVKRQLSPLSHRSFETYYASAKKRRPYVIRSLYLAAYTLNLLYQTIAEKLPIAKSLGSPLPRRFRVHPGRPSFLAHWAFDKITHRYLVEPATPPSHQSFHADHH